MRAGDSYMDLEEFRALGLLQEVNRRFFHPIGLALAMDYDEEGKPYLSGIWDERRDPEGIIFEVDGKPGLPMPDACTTYDGMVKQGRHVALGWIVQPIEAPQPSTSFTIVKTKEMPKSLGPVPDGHAMQG